MLRHHLLHHQPRTLLTGASVPCARNNQTNHFAVQLSRLAVTLVPDMTLLGTLELSVRPVSINIARLDEGDGIGNTLARNQAKWHALCHLNCSASRLGRARTQASCGVSEELSVDNQYMLRSTEHNINSKDICFFCGGVGTTMIPLREAMTQQLTQRVRQCAMKLQDQKLIARLSQTDLVAEEAK